MKNTPASLISAIWVCIVFLLLGLSMLFTSAYFDSDTRAIISGFLLLFGIFFATRGVVQGIREFKVIVAPLGIFAAIINFGVIILFIVFVILNAMDINQSLEA